MITRVQSFRPTPQVASSWIHKMDASTLGELQTAEQRQILDTITQLRKCGLDTILSLPQLVVCG
ncbi:hypothetical protein GGR55DRAFT_653890, partial [Xylaria sp. FL0064]